MMVRQRFHGKGGQYCAGATSTNLNLEEMIVEATVYYRKKVAFSQTSSPLSFKISSLGMLSNYKKDDFVGIQNQESSVPHVSDLRD